MTSEVGSDAQNSVMEQLFKQFLTEQSSIMMEMMRSIRDPSAVKKSVSLPKFNSESVDADAESWCSMVDLIFEEKPLEGIELISALSAALVGDASQWLTQSCFSGITWGQFKEIFLQRFSSTETSAATVINWLNSRPKNGETIAAYSNRLIAALQSKLSKMTHEKIAVSIALAHMSKFDQRLKRLACITEIENRAQLQNELKVFAYAAENNNNGAELPPKRAKLSTNIKCHFCGKDGHRIAECRSRREMQNNKRFTTATSKEKVVCYRCGVAGHIASACNGKKTSLSEEKRVDVCEVVEPQGVMVHSGESIPFYFDSGAECSLIKEKVISRLSGKRITNVVMIKGIGNSVVKSTLQILSVVVISDVALEILFHVVCDSYLKYDVLIGREILSQGLEVLVTANSFNISKSNVINVCSVQSEVTDLSDVNSDLDDSEKQHLLSLLEKYREYFINGIPRRRINNVQLKIRLIDSNKTVQRRPYRLSAEEKEIVKARIKELVEAGVVRPSCSPFASPILLVKKKNGTDRLCVDYRELNANTVADKFPLPLISDQIARLKGANYFSCIDMASGFHQVPVHPESIERTAFVTPDGQFEYTSMPFGLKNAPAVFQRAIVNALADLVNSYVIVYMDDVMIVSETKDEGFERLNVVLDVLAKAGFSFNFKKCAFLKTTVEYLGYLVTAGEIRPNPGKIKAVSTLPPPETITQLRQFIGLASYFRQFIHKFSEIMKPLYALTSRKTLTWSAEHEQIRLKVIKLLTDHPVLIIFDPKYPIELHTDASSEGYGAILLHRIENKPRVVEYFSKTTTAAESRYHSYELETLAVVNAVKHFRHYLFGRNFVVFTDCNSLKATRTKKDLTPRVHRWWAYLQNFVFDIQYREGKRMAHVDFLSRNPLHDANESVSLEKIESKRIDLAEITNDWFLAEQQRDTDIFAIVKQLRLGKLDEQVAKSFELRSGVLYRKIQRNGKTKCLPVVPRCFRWSVVNNIHESIMHLGWEKTLDKVYEHYWFEKMNKYVRKFVDACVTCKLTKSTSGKVQVELHPIPKVNVPWHTIHIDITGKLSGKSDIKEYVIVLIDAYTKFVLLQHTLQIDAGNCIKAIKSSIALFGIPDRIIADQGRCFASNAFRDFCRSQNIKLHLISTGASRANGQVERVMSTLKNLLTAIETSQRTWQDALGEVQIALNSTTHRVTKYSPLELLIGKESKPFGLISISDSNVAIDRDEIRNLADKNMQKVAAYDKIRFDKNKAKNCKI